MPTTRTWLKIHGYLTVVCAIFSMILGLAIWYETLRTRENLGNIWNKQPAATQSLVQQTVRSPVFLIPLLAQKNLINLQLDCCGYENSTSPPFVVDTTCPNAQVAAARLGCITPFSSKANTFLDLIFTGAFGIVGLDAVLVILIAIVLKDRKEKERYRFIDEKNGAGAF